jgi:hypothetical protein
MSALPVLTPAQGRRLRALWRSAGWPAHDPAEAELLVLGLLERREDAAGRETYRLTDTGLQVLVALQARGRAAFSAHQRLEQRVAQDLARAGRLAWRGLGLRAKVSRKADAAVATGMPEGFFPAVMPGAPAGPSGVDGAAPGSVATDAPVVATGPVTHRAGATGVPPDPVWHWGLPDVFSLRHTTVVDYLDPAVHEIKVRRADLLSDLRDPGKREAYLQMAGQCWYVLAAGIGEAEEIPADCGVIVAHGEDFARLEVLRAAPRRPRDPAFMQQAGLPLAVWLALARATPEPAPDDDQAMLGEAD